MDCTNPVLNADRPDLDVVRAGDDFLAVFSGSNRVPGPRAAAEEALSVGVRTVTVRAGCDAEGMIGFAWRTSGAWRAVATRFPAVTGRWIGADTGVFAGAPLGAPDGGDHGTFGTMSVDLVGSEEVAA